LWGGQGDFFLVCGFGGGGVNPPPAFFWGGGGGGGAPLIIFSWWVSWGGRPAPRPASKFGRGWGSRRRTHRVIRRKVRGGRRKNGAPVSYSSRFTAWRPRHGGSAHLGGSSRVIEGIQVCTEVASVRAGGPRVSLGWSMTAAHPPGRRRRDRRHEDVQVASESASAPQRAMLSRKPSAGAATPFGASPRLARAGAVSLAVSASALASVVG
jgi:hypothetical protein